MVNSLVNSIIGMFGAFTSAKFGGEIITFVISLLPILELRGGLLAASILNVKPLVAYIIAIVGNLLPIPFILMFEKLEAKAMKNKDKFEKGEFIALILFVGIPLPGTGAWTGALIASVMGMDKKKAMLAILLGVIMASIIMMIISYGVVNNLIYN